MSVDYYKLLDVTPSSSKEEILKAYKKLALRHHPDKGGTAETFAQYLEAKDVLIDPSKRQEYDTKRQASTARWSFKTGSTSTAESRKHKKYTSYSHTGEYKDYGYTYDRERDPEREQQSQKKHRNRQQSFRSDERSHRANPFHSDFTSTFGDKRNAFHNMYTRFDRSRSRYSGKAPKSSAWGSYEEPEDTGDETNNQYGEYNKNTAEEEFQDEAPAEGFEFEFGSTSRKKTESTSKQPWTAEESDTDSASSSNIRDETSQHNGRQRHFTSNDKYKEQWDEGIREAADAAAAAGSDDDEDPHADDDYFDASDLNEGSDIEEEEKSTEYVDLTNETDAEDAPDDRAEVEEQQEPLEQHEANRANNANEAPAVGTKHTETDDHEEIPTSPRKKARTERSSFAESILNQAPFTQTHGHFNMDGIADTILGSGPSSSSRKNGRFETTANTHQAEYVDPSKRGPTFSSTSTPVNSFRPKSYRPAERPRKIFELNDHISVLQLNAPNAPIVPDVNTVTQESLQIYSSSVEQYQAAWAEYNLRVSEYFHSRATADGSNGIELLRTLEGSKEYMDALQLDAKVRLLWNVALETHVRVVSSFMAIKDAVERQL